MSDDDSTGADIRERTFEFGCAVVELHRRIYGTSPDLSRQALKAGTAVGALLEEADAGQSRADFINKCTISLKEAREVRYWLRMLARFTETQRIQPLIGESTQLVAILTTIVKKSRRE